MQNDMRDRLVEFLSYFADGYKAENRHIVPYTKVCDIANHLIENNVQEVKQATWIINPDGYYPYCSNCNYEPDRPTIHSDNRTPYCPNCGAKMKKECE